MPDILIVEDDTFARTLYTDHLTAEGFSVRAEPDVSHALAALEKRPADLLVAKIGHGESLARPLLSAARRRSPRIDLIALVERDAMDAAARALREGASDYLLKPVTRGALALAAWRCLELQEAASQRPSLGRELALWQRCQAMTFAAGGEDAIERLTTLLSEQAGARAAIAVTRTERDIELAARVGLDRELASRIVASWGREKPGVHKDLGAPILVEVPGHFTAALYGANPSPSLEADLTFLAVRGAKSLALQNRYGDAASGQTAIDPLSGTYDARYVRRVLGDEIARVSGGGPPVALLTVDLDGFRAVNDQHGHLVGGKVLVESARVLERCVREVDVVGRAGADEFTVILLGTTAVGAAGAAERIRRAFESHLFLVREQLNLKMTVSIGVAACPEHGQTAEAVLAAADRAVRAAKARESSCVAVAPL